jgi:HAE1 family hydrophobic/amphiphilic exporter-1
MNLIKTAINQPVTVTVGVVLIILAGIVSLSRLPIALTPNVEQTVVTVTTFWEGASPEEVEQNVVDKQEERLLGLSNLKSITSTSQQSQAIIRLEFNTGTDPDDARTEISDKLREVPEYPEGVDEPVIQTSDRETRDYIAWIMFGSTDPSFDVRTARDFAVDRIEPMLERVPGIAEITVLGGREREVQIRIDPVRLAQYGIPPTQFANVIRETNVNVSAGQVELGKLDVRLRTVGQYTDLDEIERTVIVDRPGGPVLVRDVAEVVQTFKEPTNFVRSKGRPVIAINAEREVGSNVMSVMAGLKQSIADLNAPGGLLEAEARRLNLDGELYLEQVYDQTIYIDDALALVRNNIFIGGALATIVLILFLRSIRSVSVVVLAIPISVIGAVVAMVAMGRSINVISLAGMAFAVGMVVDNAIVVLENIFRHLEMGKRPMQAAFDGAKEVWGAVLASTLTTIVVFIPILLVEEEAGQLFRDIALAICAAVGLSLIVSITVIPCAAGRLLKNGKTKVDRKGRVKEKKHRISDAMSRLIHSLCGSTVARVGVVAGLTAGAVVGTWALMPPADYLPAGNRNLVFGLIIPPPGYNVDQMSDMGHRLEDVVEPFWEAGDLYDKWQHLIEEGNEQQAKQARQEYERAVEQLPSVPTFDWQTQSPGPPVTPPSIHNYFVVSFEGIMFHGAISDDPSRVVDIVTLLNHAVRQEVLPGTIAFAFQAPLFQLGGSTGAAVKLELSGADLDQVIDVASGLYNELGATYGYSAIQPVPGNFMIPGPEMQVRPDLVRLSEVGLTMGDVGLAVRASGDGAIIDEYNLGGETIDLVVISKYAVDNRSLEDLRDLPIASPAGRVVPLESIADVFRVGSPQEIARASRQRAVTFQITPPKGVPLETLVEEIEQMIADGRVSGAIPPAIQSNLAGSASKLEAVRAALLGDGTFIGLISSSLVLALVVVYLLMCVLFQSFIKPLVIMLSVPLATLGGFAALFIVFIWSATNRYMPMQMLDVLTMLGFVILIGIVVNNAILLVHQTNNFLTGRGETGTGSNEPMTPRRAIAEAVRTRVRPIFMSMMTSIGGMLPLVLMPGSGSELYRGLGSVVVGGLLVSTIFTLVLVPLLLSLVLDLSWKVRGEATPRTAEALPPKGAVPATE